MAEALFENTHNALVFAFHFSAEQYAETLLSRLIRRGCGSGKGLVGLDGAGQAGMVLAEIGRLGDLEQAVIAARFAPKFEECPCCGGEKPTKVWRDAIEKLTAWAVPAGVSNMRARRELVSKFFGVRGIEFKALAERYGMNRKTVAEQYQNVAKRLKDLDSRAQCALDDALKSGGMVVGED